MSALMTFIVMMYFLHYRFESIKSGTVSSSEIVLFLIWVALLLTPLFSEVAILGLKLKKEPDVGSGKTERPEPKGITPINVRLSLADATHRHTSTEPNLSTQPASGTTTNGATDSAGDASGFGQQTEVRAERRPSLRLSLGSLKVLSTLWKHQQQYYKGKDEKGRWSFIVGPTNPNYSDYALGVGETMKLGLTTISPNNGQSILTDAGIEYCKDPPNHLFPDWNYERWKQPDAMTWDSSNFIGVHRTQKGFYRLHYYENLRLGEAIGPLKEGVLFPGPSELLEDLVNREEARRRLEAVLDERDGPKE